MEIISQTEYQDAYRIVDGFQLVVNKFYTNEQKDFNKQYEIPQNYYRKLNKGIKDDLWVLTKPITYTYLVFDDDFCCDVEAEGLFTVGTVFYNKKLVYKSDNPNDWHCYVRTAWGANHGSLDYWINVSKRIQEILQKYKDEYNQNIS